MNIPRPILSSIAGLTLWLTSSLSGHATNLTHAVSFDGATQYARLASNHDALANVGTMTGEVWFKTTTAKDQCLISHYGRSGRDAGWYFGLRSDGQTARLRWQARQSQVSHEFSLPARYDDGQWHSLGFTANGEQIEVFFEGQSLGTQVAEGRLVPPGTPFAIGTLPVAGIWFFEGQLAEVRFWRGARTPEQIAANYNRRLFGNEPDLLGYWPLNDGSGTVAADVSSSGFDATLYGAPAWGETDLDLSTFVVADSVTGDREYIHGTPAAVVRFPTPPGYDLYAVTQTNTPPGTGWTSTHTPPNSIPLLLPASPGPVTLYAWFTNSSEAYPSYRDTYTFEYREEATIATDGSGGGSVTRTPDEPDDIYALGVSLRLEAQADTGRHFLYWRGDLPPGAYPTNNPLDFLVDRDRDITAVFTADDAPVRIWTGGGGDTWASTSANWAENTAPQAGDSVFFGFTPEAALTDCAWDLNIAVSNWTQTADFPGTVTFQTVYPGAGAFSNLTVTGNVTLEGGVWTHPVNDDVPVNRLAATIGGAFTLGTNAMIDLMGRGFGNYKGPAPGIYAGARNGRGGGHAGMNANGSAYLPSSCYGDPVDPVTLGSGGIQPGGGALHLSVGGAAVIDGMLNAEGEHNGGSDQDVYSGAAGGSIRLRSASIEGSGRITARGSIGYYNGAGGRISLVATDSPSISTNLKISAAAGQVAWGARSAGGTRYVKTTAGEQLVFDGQNLPPQAGLASELPALNEVYPTHPAVGGPMENATLILTNGANVIMPRYLRLGDFATIDATSTLDLNSYTLYLKAAEPPGAFPGDYGNGTIVSNGGSILWGDTTAEFDLIVTTGPGGSVSAAPESPDGMYEIETEVTVSAIPDSENHFLAWQGELPPGTSRTNNPLTLVMTRRYELRALFATNAPNFSTWTGEGEDDLASTPENWYPTNAPVSGNHILFNAISDKRCEWDLDIQPASWTQTEAYESFWSEAEGYRGWVDFMIRYPGHGAFTNLTITGDVDLQGGTWSHDFNDAADVETDRLWITVEGDFTLGPQAEINMNRRAGSGGYDVMSRGFGNQRGPSPGSGGARGGVLYGASYGGRGGYLSDSAPQPCYGTFSAPENHGSGGYRGGGGGSIRLEVAGTAAIEGLVDVGTDSDYRHSGGAGGSIWLTAGALSGNGRLHAYAGRGYLGGGGGRIAVILTESEEFADLDLRAWGGYRRGGEAGTIYLRNAVGRQRLIVDNNGYTGDPLVNYTELYDDGITDFREVELEIRNGGRVGIDLSDPRIKNLTMDATSTLYLLGHDLVVRSPEPGDPLAGTIVPDGGSLTWTPRGTMILLR